MWLASVAVNAEVPYDAVKNQLYSHILLPEETSSGPPRRWIQHRMQGRGSDEIILGVRGDNMRIPRFANQEGTWHACRSDDLHGLTPSARLSFDDDYTSLLGGHEHLKDLRVGYHTVVDAITELARFRATNRTWDSDVGARRALATLRVCISESLRFKSIRQTVAAAWFNGGATLDDRQVELVGNSNWRTMSCALLIAAQNGGAWSSQEAAHLRSIGMFSKEDVLEEIDEIMWPNDCSEAITLGSRDSTRTVLPRPLIRLLSTNICSD